MNSTRDLWRNLAVKAIRAPVCAPVDTDFAVNDGDAVLFGLLGLLQCRDGRRSTAAYRQTLGSTCAGGCAGQPELFGSGEKMLDGGWVPPRSTTRRTFAHGLKL